MTNTFDKTMNAWLFQNADTSYKFRNSPCNIQPDEKLWSVSGLFYGFGGGVLEWCHDEEDALYVLAKMSKDDRAYCLSAEKFAPERQTHHKTAQMRRTEAMLRMRQGLRYYNRLAVWTTSDHALSIDEELGRKTLHERHAAFMAADIYPNKSISCIITNYDRTQLVVRDHASIAAISRTVTFMQDRNDAAYTHKFAKGIPADIIELERLRKRDYAVLNLPAHPFFLFD